MVKEIAGFFTASLFEQDTLTFVGWYYDDASDLVQIPYNVPGLVLLAYSDNAQDTIASDRVVIKAVLQSDNVKNIFT